MSGRIGVELTPGVVRAVRLQPLTGRLARALELPWNPDRPRDVVVLLSESLGRPSSIALAVGMAFVQVKAVKLPPAPAEARGRMLALEPERYFAAAERPLVTSLSDTAEVAFAADRERVAAWIAAFESLAPVTCVEPAAMSVARAIGAGGSGEYRLEAGAGEMALVHLERGALRMARRAREGAAPDARPAPPLRGAAPAYAAAIGAALGAEASGTTQLAPDEWKESAAAARGNRMLLSVAAVAAALLFALFAADRYRDRTLGVLDARVTELEQQSGPASEAMQALLSRQAEAIAVRSGASRRADPLGALAAIGLALPKDAVILAARANGDEWQIDGTARDASRLVPTLDGAGRFDNVRFLTASSRYREGSRSYETFSIALRYRPRP